MCRAGLSGRVGAEFLFFYVSYLLCIQMERSSMKLSGLEFSREIWAEELN